jgi:tRNA pseudouridine38-40 synthase
MNQGATPLVGEHDFSAFCRRPPTSPGHEERSLARRVTEATWEDLGDGRLRFDIAATSFCHQMVRSVTAMLVDVGRGRRRAADVVSTLASMDRAKSAGVAPPHGLCLVAVGYPAE